MQSSHQRHYVVVVDFEVSAALRAELSQVRVEKLRSVVYILLRYVKIELE